MCDRRWRLLDAGELSRARLSSQYFGQFYTRFAWAGCNREVWTPRTGRLCLQIGNLMMTKPSGFTSAFSDYDEPRDHLYALEAPVYTVALPLESESEAGLCDFVRCLQE